MRIIVHSSRTHITAQNSSDNFPAYPRCLLSAWSCCRSRRGESTRRSLRQRSTASRHRASADRRDGAPGCPTVRHFPTTSRLTRMCQQNSRTVGNSRAFYCTNPTFGCQISINFLFLLFFFFFFFFDSGTDAKSLFNRFNRDLMWFNFTPPKLKIAQHIYDRKSHNSNWGGNREKKALKALIQTSTIQIFVGINRSVCVPCDWSSIMSRLMIVIA